MIMKVRGVTGIPVPNGDHMVEIGYVILPEKVNRANFVDTCNATSRVSVVIDRSGSVIHNCLVVDQVYQDLKIPETTSEVGTPVLLLKTIYNEKPIVVGTMRPTNSDRVYEENVVEKVFGDSNGVIIARASLNDGSLLVNVNGLGERKLNIVVNGEEGSGIEVNTNGDIVEIANGKVSVKSFNQVEATVIDADNDTSSTVVIDKENITLDPSKKMNVKGGKEPIPLGDTLKEILQSINDNIDTLKQAWSTGNNAVSPASQGSTAGGGGTAFAAAVAAVSGIASPDLSKLNSEISFTD